MPELIREENSDRHWEMLAARLTSTPCDAAFQDLQSLQRDLPLCDLQRDLDRFAAARGAKTFLSSARRDLRQKLRQFDPRPVKIVRINVGNSRPSTSHRPIPAKIANAPSRQKIDVTFPVGVKHVASFRARNLKILRVRITAEKLPRSLFELQINETSRIPSPAV
jgi:hypothetical protein